MKTAKKYLNEAKNQTALKKLVIEPTYVAFELSSAELIKPNGNPKQCEDIKFNHRMNSFKSYVFMVRDKTVDGKVRIFGDITAANGTHEYKRIMDNIKKRLSETSLPKSVSNFIYNEIVKLTK